jgi:hypothetical protein
MNKSPKLPVNWSFPEGLVKNNLFFTVVNIFFSSNVDFNFVKYLPYYGSLMFILLLSEVIETLPVFEA